MPKLLSTLGGAAAIYGGIQAGRELEQVRRERERQRKRQPTLEAREEEIYEQGKRTRQRAAERGDIEQRDFLRSKEEEEGARRASEGAGGGVSADNGAPITLPQIGPPEQPEPLPPATGDEGEVLELGTSKPLSAAGGASAPQPRMLGSVNAPATGAAPAGPPKVKWLAQAEAQRDYWTRKGRADRAQQVMVDAYKRAFSEDEARYKFETQPQEQKIRALNLGTEELKAHQGAQELQKTAINNQLMAAGKLWGLMQIGAAREALELFNASAMLQPGVKAVEAKVMKAKGPDGNIVDVMVLLDAQGAPVKDKNGQELIYPVSLLEGMRRLATTTTEKLTKGQSIYQITRDPSGKVTSTPIVTAPDPDAGDKKKTSDLRTDKAWNEAINKARDDADRYLRNNLGVTSNPMSGKLNSPENLPIYERAMPRIERRLAEARAKGTTLDQLSGQVIAKEELDAVRDELKRGKSGAGARGAPAAGPTWRDMLK